MVGANTNTRDPGRGEGVLDVPPKRRAQHEEDAFVRFKWGVVVVKEPRESVERNGSFARARYALNKDGGVRVDRDRTKLLGGDE